MNSRLRWRSLDYFNGDPVVQTWTYKLTRPHDMISNFTSSAAIGAFGHGALDAALDRLMMQFERPTCRKNDGSSRPAISAPARPGLSVPFAIAQSISTSPNPNLRATIQSAAATLP